MAKTIPYSGIPHGEEANPSFALSADREERMKEQQSYSISRDTKSLIADEILDVFSSSASVNQDGEDATPVTKEVVASAMSLTRLLPEGVLKPEMSAGPKGNILFDWHGNLGEMLTISCSDADKFY